MSAVEFSPDGRMLAVALATGHVLLIDAQTMGSIRTLHADTGAAHATFATFSPDGRLLATGWLVGRRSALGRGLRATGGAFPRVRPARSLSVVFDPERRAHRHRRAEAPTARHACGMRRPAINSAPPSPASTTSGTRPRSHRMDPSWSSCTRTARPSSGPRAGRPGRPTPVRSPAVSSLGRSGARSSRTGRTSRKCARPTLFLDFATAFSRSDGGGGRVIQSHNRGLSRKQTN